MTKNYDYYENSEMFYHKQNDVQETIDYLKEECEKLIDFKVLEEYGDADEKEEARNYDSCPKDENAEELEPCDCKEEENEVLD